MKTDTLEKKVELKSISKSYYSSGVNKKACDCVDFLAEPGKITGVIGLNGAGKSTLLKIICGFHYADSGTLNVYGQSDSLEIRKITGYVPETPQLDNNLTVFETLCLTADIYGVKKSETEKYINEAVKAASLTDVLNVSVSALSKGYRQRLSLAKALCHNPEILVLDEFSGGLDPLQIKELRQELKIIARTRTVIISTHNIDEASGLCSKIYILNKGKVADILLESSGSNIPAEEIEKRFIEITKEK